MHVILYHLVLWGGGGGCSVQSISALGRCTTLLALRGSAKFPEKCVT